MGPIGPDEPDRAGRGPPLAPASPVLTRVAILASAIEDLSGDRGRPVRLDLRAVLAGRAASLGWLRGGTSRPTELADCCPRPTAGWR